MNEILKKLKYSTQNPVLLLNVPEEYKEIMKDITSDIHTAIQGKYGLIQLFARNRTEAESKVQDAIKALDIDGYLWICYPKGTSKKYKSDLNRNGVLEVAAPYNFEGVTLVAIDEDWSALRIKDVDDIKTMKRKTAVSEKGKERIGEKA